MEKKNIPPAKDSLKNAKDSLYAPARPQKLILYLPPTPHLADKQALHDVYKERTSNGLSLETSDDILEQRR